MLNIRNVASQLLTEIFAKRSISVCLIETADPVLSFGNLLRKLLSVEKLLGVFPSRYSFGNRFRRFLFGFFQSSFPSENPSRRPVRKSPQENSSGSSFESRDSLFQLKRDGMVEIARLANLTTPNAFERETKAVDTREFARGDDAFISKWIDRRSKGASEDEMSSVTGTSTPPSVDSSVFRFLRLSIPFSVRSFVRRTLSDSA